MPKGKKANAEKVAKVAPEDAIQEDESAEAGASEADEID